MLALPKNRTREREIEWASAIMLFARRKHGMEPVCVCAPAYTENDNKIIYSKNNYLKKHLKANACTEYKHTPTTHLRALVRSTIIGNIASLSGYNSAHYINMDTIALYLYSWNCYKCCSVEQSLQFHFSGSECAAFFLFLSRHFFLLVCRVLFVLSFCMWQIFFVVAAAATSTRIHQPISTPF